jgi:hypothetical protein
MSLNGFMSTKTNFDFLPIFVNENERLIKFESFPKLHSINCGSKLGGDGVVCGKVVGEGVGSVIGSAEGNGL